jgi:hypothetical protein
MGRVLRSLVQWSFSQKASQSEDEHLSLCYSQGTLEIIHKIISTSNAPQEQKAEEAFWILVGMIRMYPRCFTIKESILTADCSSMMRYEIITFKALVEQNLPEVWHKLKKIGLPIEQIINQPIMSLYANFFSTGCVLRLWDLIFLSFSSHDHEKRKQGLWYIMAPAYLIISEVKEKILKANTSREIITAFQSGSSLYFNANDFI